MISHKNKRNNPQICAIMGNCGVLRYETYSIFLYAIVGKERQICNCLRYTVTVQFPGFVCFHSFIVY